MFVLRRPCLELLLHGRRGGVGGERGDGKGFVGWLVCLTSQQQVVYLRDGSAQTILRAATLR